MHEIVDFAFDEDLDPELFRLAGAPEPSERSPTLGRPPRPILCSFCGRSQREVMQLIAGPGVYICDQCLDLCNEIVREARGPGQA